MDATAARFAGDSLTRFRRALRRWYRRNARNLPWRQTTDPYRIWISEIMLQQTTVAAVVPYYERFLNRFPTVRKLAAADEQDVLRLWEGLGYYSRARNIHRAAQVIVSERAGRFPDDVDELQTLPGIGRYTAGAIASFAFDRAAPIVEANTLRLYCRLLGFSDDPRTGAGQRRLWEFASRIVPRTLPGRFNQALMELGATICTPENPHCDRCPVRPWCGAFRDGRQAEIPHAAKRRVFTDIVEAAVAVERDGQYLLLKRPPGSRWAGLWDFVRFELPRPHDIPSIKRRKINRQSQVNGASPRKVPHSFANAAPPSNETARELTHLVSVETGVVVDIRQLLTELRHGVTRFRITLQCYFAEWRSGEPDPAQREFDWVAPNRFEAYPLSTTGRKLARIIQAK